MDIDQTIIADTMDKIISRIKSLADPTDQDMSDIFFEELSSLYSHAFMLGASTAATLAERKLQ